MANEKRITDETIDGERFDYHRWAYRSAGEMIRAAVDQSQLSINDAAARLEINRVTLSKIMTGAKPISLAMAKRMQRTFNISAYALARWQFENDFANEMGSNNASEDK
jgi:plasmid maintenance system antidote protein VapI